MPRGAGKSTLDGSFDLPGATKFMQPYRCAEGLCAVSKGGLWGFVDYLGNLVLDFRYPTLAMEVPHFSHGTCVVGSPESKDAGTAGFIFIDKKGNQLFGKQVFPYASPFVEEVTTVTLFKMNPSTGPHVQRWDRLGCKTATGC
jgi:hypothetical protein